MKMLFNEQGQVVNLAEGVDIYDYAAEYGGTIVEMLSERPSLDYQAMPDGTWAIPLDVLRAWAEYEENYWRATELATTREIIIAIEYGDDTIQGTEAQWKAYWQAVRKWDSSNPGFPDSQLRPTRPK